MQVTNAPERVFTCQEDEEITVEIRAANTLYTVLSDFHPPVPNQSEDNGDDEGAITFTATKGTVLTLEFHFSGDTGGRYDLVFSPIDGDADGFHQRVEQKFGAKKRMRLYSFLVE